tara:strand:+ start:296 stop:946 length:651 start_codon:yes stop_codon:yes gene_type:complete
MFKLEKCRKIFIDFDGVIVDSNKFKEEAIQHAIIKLLGHTKNNIKAIEYFNINAGISRKKKLSLFFKEKDITQIMEIYSKDCKKFFSTANPTNGLKEFLAYLNINHKNIKKYILSGGEKGEIEYFLNKNSLNDFFEEILASEKSKLKHLKDKQVEHNDIFIGDSKNDLKAAIESGIKFILFEEYKSLKSYPKDEFIKKDIILKTKNFESLIFLLSQ